MLETHDLAARRGDAQLFSGVSLSLGPGTALFVRGPNGSGKTTLLRILAGTTPAAAGRVLWRGEQVGPIRLCEAVSAHLAAGGIAVIATHQDLPIASGAQQSLLLA